MPDLFRSGGAEGRQSHFCGVLPQKLGQSPKLAYANETLAEWQPFGDNGVLFAGNIFPYFPGSCCIGENRPRLATARMPWLHLLGVMLRLVFDVSAAFFRWRS